MPTGNAVYKLLVTISPEEMSQITNPVFTLNANGQSTGLSFEQTSEHYYTNESSFHLTDGVKVSYIDFVPDETQSYFTIKCEGLVFPDTIANISMDAKQIDISPDFAQAVITVVQQM